MEFNSIIFICLFFPLLMMTYYFTRLEFKNLILLIFSMFFYAWGSLKGLCVLLVLTVINYYIGLLLEKSNRNKSLLVLGILLNTITLCYFKYTNFLIDNLNTFMKSNLEFLTILVPIGISFFVFKAISYLVDIYRKKSEAEKNIVDFMLYMLFFSQVLSGPIIRYVDVRNDLKSREILPSDVQEGLKRFIIGLSKKVIFANNLGMLVDTIWSVSTHEMTVSVAWLGSIAYTLQIYFDFSGYSDMAIGLARIFGFKFKENFNYPYISKSISEFWRRWHISLSSWFKDYIYIPLGGSRKGNVYFNIFIVFLVTGIWHGSAWSFIIWGLWNGMFNMLEKYVSKKGYVVGSGNTVCQVLSYIYTMIVVNLGWVLFRAPNLKHACSYFLSMIGLNRIDSIGYTVQWYLDTFTILIIVLAFIACFPLGSIIYHKFKSSFKYNIFVENLTLLILFIISISFIISSSYSSFIYFQF